MLKLFFFSSRQTNGGTAIPKLERRSPRESSLCPAVCSGQLGMRLWLQEGLPPCQSQLLSVQLSPQPCTQVLFLLFANTLETCVPLPAMAWHCKGHPPPVGTALSLLPLVPPCATSHLASASLWQLCVQRQLGVRGEDEDLEAKKFPSPGLLSGKPFIPQAAF